MFSTYRINFGHCMVSDNYDDLDYARWALNKLRAENVEYVEKYHLEGWDGRRWHRVDDRQTGEVRR